MHPMAAIILVPGFLFLSFSASAKSLSKKTLDHHCAVYKTQARKAGNLYSQNKKQARQIHQRIKALKDDNNRIPQSVKLTKTLLKQQINKLDAGKKQKLATSLKYLEKHLKFKQAARKSCQSAKKIRSLRPQPLAPKILTIAGD